MNFTEECYFYYSCERCGRGYYADVGWGGCPNCTTKEMQEFYLEKENKRQLELKKRRDYLDSDEYRALKDLEIQLEDNDEDRSY